MVVDKQVELDSLTTAWEETKLHIDLTTNDSMRDDDFKIAGFKQSNIVFRTRVNNLPFKQVIRGIIYCRIFNYTQGVRNQGGLAQLMDSIDRQDQSVVPRSRPLCVCVGTGGGGHDVGHHQEEPPHD